MAVFGPNASGKTAILEAVDLFRSIVLSGFSPSFYRPNKILSGPANSSVPTEVALTFNVGRNKYTYALGWSGSGIVTEELLNGKITVFRIKEASVEELCTDLSKFRDTLNAEFKQRCFTPETENQQHTFLHSAGNAFAEASKNIADTLNFLENHLTSLCSAGYPSPSGTIRTLCNCYDDKNEDARRKRAELEITDLMKKLDFPVEGISVQNVPTAAISEPPLNPDQPTPNADQAATVRIRHKSAAGESVTFDLFKEESKGTQRLFLLSGYILAALKSGQALFIDDLEASLHPQITKTLISMFTDKDLNRKGAQLIFTAHDAELLSGQSLRLSEVSLVDQRGFSGTQLKKLSSVPHLRKTEDLQSRYLRGDFEGIPYPYA
jgi:hypothetical protein